MKTALTALAIVAVLAAPIALSGCGGQATGGSAPAEAQAEPEKKVEPGIVDIDGLKEGTKYCLETWGAPYDELAEAFGNEGAPYNEENWDDHQTYEWMTEDGANSILITFRIEEDGSLAKSGSSWMGDEIEEYAATL